MSLWRTREKALTALEDEMQLEGTVMEEAFARLRECIQRLEQMETMYARVCGLTLVKARNLAFGCYGLCLDGLAQEAGALIRPLLETLELLVYFRLDPARVEQAATGTLPSAGKRAKAIESQLQAVRDYFNQHSSHVTWSLDSMRHLVDWKAGSFRVEQAFSPKVLRRNLQFLFAMVMFITVEGVNAVGKGGEMLQHELGDRVVELKNRGSRSSTSESKAGTSQHDLAPTLAHSE